MALYSMQNKVVGKYKAPRYRCTGLDRGVPFTRVYRTKRAMLKLQQKPGITLFTYVTLN